MNPRLRLADAIRRLADLVDDHAERARHVYAEAAGIAAEAELLQRLQTIATTAKPAPVPTPEPPQPRACTTCTSLLDAAVASADWETLAQRTRFLQFVTFGPVVSTTDGSSMCAIHATASNVLAQPEARQ